MSILSVTSVGGSALGARETREDAQYDRARGGQLKVKLTIPEKRLDVKGNFGFVIVPKQTVEFVIDLERMPLVNVSGYAVDRIQTGPPLIEYPNGTGATVDKTFG
jgi:hypothetical protein